MVNIENQIQLLKQLLEYGIENDNSQEALRERLYKARNKMLDEQEEISRIDQNNFHYYSAYIGRK